MPIDVTTLIDVYTAGEGLTLTGNQFSVDKTKVAQKDDFDKLKAALVDSASINGNDIATEGQDGNIIGNAINLDSSDIKIQNNYNKYATLVDVTKGEGIGSAIAKLEYKADKALDDAAAAAANAGVTSVGGQKGDITLDNNGAGSYPVKLTMDGKKIKASVFGLGSAAAHLETDFATQAQGVKADNSVQLLDAGDSGHINGAFGASTIYFGAKDSVAPGNLWVSSTVRNEEDINIAVLSINSNKESVGSSNRAISGVTAVSSDFDVTNKQYVDRKISTEISAAITWTEI